MVSNSAPIVSSNIISKAGTGDNKIAPEIKPPSISTASPLNAGDARPSVLSKPQGIVNQKTMKKSPVTAIEIRVGMKIKLKRMGTFMLVAGCCTLLSTMLLSLTVIKMEKRSGFMYGFIYIGNYIFGQVSMIMQLVAIRTSIRKSQDFVDK